MMNLSCLILVGILGLAAMARGQAPASQPFAPAVALPAGYRLVWADEFDYPNEKLDDRWIAQNGPSTHILCSRWRENAVVSDGTLKLINRKEKRGGQDWTSASLWTRDRFKYGYYECRYRYAAAEGTNSSFWIMMSPDDQPVLGKRFEIDINEGHYPNEVATNIHNHSDVTEVNGRKTHPAWSKSYRFGQQPDVRIQLETPIKTDKIRLISNGASSFQIRQFSIYGSSARGYPPVLSTDSVEGVTDFAAEPGTKISVSGHHASSGRGAEKNVVDGDMRTAWIAQTEGAKWLQFDLDGEKTVGCIQFVNGVQTEGQWSERSNWRSMLKEYQVQYWDGRDWVTLSAYNQGEGKVDFSRDYHTLGLLWTRDELVFYHDGQELRRDKNAFCHDPAPVWLSEAIITWSGKVTDAIDGTRMEVDYVRVYQRDGDELVRDKSSTR